MSRSMSAVAGACLTALFVSPAAIAGPPMPMRHQGAPPPTLVRNVRMEGSETAVQLLLRDGRIEAVLAADAEVPAGVHDVDGAGRLVLPGFIDGFTTSGFEMPTPEKDRDVAADTTSDVRIDMRSANRKGLQPAFRVVEALAVGNEVFSGYQKAGFGAMLPSPHGELMGGNSALVATREAAMRDVVIAPEVFAHATFDASGPGYPSTLMGFMAQLRQFFLDVEHHAVLTERFSEGRPGVRPAWDVELESGLPILSGKRRICCDAETARDIERWIKLADEFGFELAISGGRDAWKLADELARRGIPVILTLDWGDEVDDPSPDEKTDEAAPEGGEEVEPRPEAAGDLEADTAAPADTEPRDADSSTGEDPAAEEPAGEASAAAEAPEEASEEAPEVVWEYQLPLRVREERRRLWEEKRDNALRLHEAGVRICFGAGGQKPKELIGKVRELVEAGMPREVALAALTTSAAELLGVSERLGRLEVGQDASFALWTANPLVEKKAQVAWSFVDGFGHEFEIEDNPVDESPPDEGLDATGTWKVETDSEQGGSSELKLTMDDDGAVTGTLVHVSGRDGETRRSDLTGRLSGSTLRLEGTLSFSPEFQFEMSYELEFVDGQLEGEITMNGPGFENVQKMTGTRQPEGK